MHQVPTGPDGSFAVAALPGRGWLAVRAGDAFLTAEKRGDLEPKPNGGPTGWLPALPSLLFPYQFHAVIPVEPREGERELRRDIVLIPKGQAAAAVSRGRTP
jgi:hypothetical protein